MSNIGERSCTNRPAYGLVMTAMPAARRTGRVTRSPSSPRVSSLISRVFRMSTSSLREEFTDIAVHEGRLLVHDPVGAVGDPSQPELRHVPLQPFQVAGRQRLVPLA